MKKILSILILIAFVIPVLAQEIAPIEKGEQFGVKKDYGYSHAQKNIIRNTGDILFSFQTTSGRDPLGVTIVDTTIILSATDNNGNNYFEKYTFTGQFISETPQTTTSTYGYRDLAFNGTNILGSDDNTIDKIDPVTFTVVSSITNTDNSVHRGLAFDYSGNAIYSTNYHNGKLLKIDAASGSTIKNYGHPDYTPYGIAFDKFSNPLYASLWFLENSHYGEFRLARVDTTNGHDNYIIDLSAQLPDSSLSGGLEITNSIPAFPDKIIAIAVDQHNHQILFVDITDADYYLPTELELTDEFAGSDLGIETRGMISYLPYLYSIESGNLSLYDIETDPAHPVYVKTDSSIGHLTGGFGGNKIFKYGDKAFITVTGPYPAHNGTGFTTVESYSLSDAANPEYLNRVDVNKPIRDAAFFNNDIYLVHGLESNTFSVVKWYSDGTLQLIHQYVLLSNSGEPAYAADVEIDLNNHLMFLSYIYTSTTGYEHSGIWVYDIADEDNIVKLFTLDTTGDVPLVMQSLPNFRLVVLLNHDVNSNRCKIRCYDYSDLTSLTFLNFLEVSDSHIAYDMKTLKTNQLAIGLQDEGVKTYYWDETTHEFFTGPSIALIHAADIIHYSVPAANPLKSISINSPNPDNYESYMAVSRGETSSFDPVVHGSEKVAIVKTKKPPVPDQVTLSMNISPPDAGDHGCSVTPAPGAHQYAEGTEINLYAAPNPTDGWYFTGWSGNASGTDLIHHIVLDQDKYVTANFDLLELTVSGNIGSNFYCPNAIENNTRLLELPFLVCASDAAAWLLSKISFKASGSGNDATDISSVKLFKAGTQVYSGNYSIDDGTIDVVFSPAITIGAGQCIPFKLTYDFGFEPITYAHDTTKIFHVESFGVVAEPEILSGGEIVGNTHNDSLIFALVTNSNGDYFSKINDGVNSPTTASGDTCFVCSGDYTEFVHLADTTKSIVLKSFEGASKTYIYPKVSWDHALLFSGQKEKVIDGFTFSGSNDGTGVGLGTTQSGEIKNCIFYALETGIGTNKVNNLKFHDNSFRNCNKGVNLWKSNNNEVFNNTFQDNNHAIPTISLNHSNNNYIHYNHIYQLTSDNTGMWINLKKSSHNKIESHNALQNSTKMRLIQLENHSNANEIYNNENFIIKIINYSDSNNIHDNRLKMIEMKKSTNFTSIEHNIITNSDFAGIKMWDDEIFQTSVYIGNNSIFNNKAEGIFSDNSAVTIFANDIYNNGLGSERKSGISLIDVLSSGNTISKNNIYDNKKNGIKISHCLGIEISHNNITGHNIAGPNPNSTSVGIKIFFDAPQTMKRYYIIDNYIADNCTGIDAIFIDNGIDYDDMYLSENTIENSSCENTGIHLSGISPIINGNNINDNNGNGIYCTNNAHPSVENNNIFGNAEYGLNNENENGVLIGNNNYWGNPDGPGSNGIFGNVDVTNWLSEPANLVAVAEKDTVYSKIGSPDSTILHLQNLLNFNDILYITVSDSKNWVVPFTNSPINLLDSTGIALKLNYTIPSGSSQNEISKVDYLIVSDTDSSQVSGSFYINSYIPSIHDLFVAPNMLTVAYTDTLQFSVIAHDQYNNVVPVDALWSSTNGTIDENGLFVSPDSSGEVAITALNQESGLSDVSNIYVTNEEIVLSKINISPDSATVKPFMTKQFRVHGKNQFNYPMSFIENWTSQTGTIDNDGLFTADSSAGEFFVIVSDTSGILSDTAIVIIEQPTDVNEKILPDKFTLSQNYPNPFNPSTTIKYSLKNTSFVVLEVFNILGQRVMKKINKILAPGVYETVLNFSRFASGVYFYRLRAIDQKSKTKNNFVDVKKMILLK